MLAVVGGVERGFDGVTLPDDAGQKLSVVRRWQIEFEMISCRTGFVRDQ